MLGKAPDMLEGVMSPELHLADALGAVGKPLHRAYTSGNAGGVAASTGVQLIAAGLHSRVLVVSFEKQSEAKAAGATLQRLPFEAPGTAGPEACSARCAANTSPAAARRRTSVTVPP